MIREIKFRAWDMIDNRMYEILSIYFEMGCLLRSDGMERTFNESILMQYTGLKDKNGVELYEGDIVDIHSKVAHTQTVGAVIYNNAALAYTIFEQFLPITINDDIEVIGNIYENEDLLND